MPFVSRDNPFPGLRPFEFEDRQFFFGRDEQIRQLTQKLFSNRFVAVIGASGSGKSSLVKAGVLGKLSRTADNAEGVDWSVMAMRPLARPLTELARAFASRQAIGDRSPTSSRESHELVIGRAEARLRRSSHGLSELLNECVLKQGERLLIIVDQFEELFRYPHADTGTDYDERALFVKQLLALAESGARPYHVLITMRSEFLGDCTQFPNLPEAISNSQFLTPRLSREQRRAAIAEPIKLAGGTIAPALLQRLLNDVGNEPDQLPIMQHALMRTWEKALPGRNLTMDDYEIVGRMDHALSRHANQVFDDLRPGAEKQVAERVFRALTDVDRQGRATRRPIRYSALKEEVGQSEQDLNAVLDVFRKAHCALLVPFAGTPMENDTVVDISHEALIRKWDKLRRWVEQEAEDGRAYLRLADLSHDFDRNPRILLGSGEALERQKWWRSTSPTAAWAKRHGGQFESVERLLNTSVRAARSDRFRRVTLPLSLVLTLCSIGAVVFAIWAFEQRDEAVSARRVAEANAEEANKQRTEAEKQSRLAEEKRKELEVTAKDLQKLVETTGAEKAVIQAEAQAIRTRLLARQAQDRLDEGDFAGAIKTALEALPREASDEKVRQRQPKIMRVLSTAVAAAPIVSNWHTAYRSANAITFAADGTRALIELNGESFRVWNPKTNEVIADFPGRVAALSPDGKKLLTYSASGAGDGTKPSSGFKVWDVDAKHALYEIESSYVSFGYNPITFSWSPDNSRFAIARGSDAAVILDAETGKNPTIIKMPKPGPTDGARLTLNYLDFSPDGKRVLARGNLLYTARLFDAENGKELKVLRDGHVPRRGLIKAAEFSSDGTRVVTGGLDGRAVIWDVRSGQPLLTLLHDDLVSYGYAVEFLQFSTDGKRILTAGQRGKIRFWDTKSGEQINSFESGDGSKISVQFVSNDSLIFAATGTGQAYVWDAAGNTRWAMSFPPTGFAAATPFESGKRFITASHDGVVREWRTTLDNEYSKPVLATPRGIIEGARKLLATYAVNQ